MKRKVWRLLDDSTVEEDLTWVVWADDDLTSKQFAIDSIGVWHPVEDSQHRAVCL